VNSVTFYASNQLFVTWTVTITRHQLIFLKHEMGDRLAAIDIGRKVGIAVPLYVGELGLYVTQCRLGRGLPPYQVASWPIQLFGLATLQQRYRKTGRTDHGPI